MDIICESCNSRLKIPEEKLPKTKAVFTACPKCKKKVRVPSQSELAAESEFMQPEEAARETKDETQEAVLPRPMQYEPPLHLPADALSAFIYMSENDSAAMKSRMQKAGYFPVCAATPKEAAADILFHVFDIILIDEDFDRKLAAQKGEKAVLDIVKGLSMAIRRRSLVVLISGKVKSRDRMAAFQKSVDLVIRNDAVSDLENAIESVRNEREKIYNVFMESMKKTGKI